MNARSQNLDLTIEGHQIDEIVSCIFHTILFHRSYGKFDYKHNEENKYSVGTLGYQDIDCNFIDFTYVCCSSQQLYNNINKKINQFSNILRNIQENILKNNSNIINCNNNIITSGQISLEFFKKNKKRWPSLFNNEINIPWELWNVRLELIKLNNEQERRLSCEKIVNVLGDHILYICDSMNRNDYVPNIPIKSDLDLIFDTSYIDIQPYLFKIHFLTPPSCCVHLHHVNIPTGDNNLSNINSSPITTTGGEGISGIGGGETGVGDTNISGNSGGILQRDISSTSPNAKEQVLANLCNFSYDPINYEYIRQLNVINLYFEIISESQNEIFISHAMGGICNLCLDKENKAYIISIGGIQPIKSLLLNSTNEQTVLNSITTLMFLITPESKQEITSTPVISKMIELSQLINQTRFSNLAKIFLNDYCTQEQITTAQEYMTMILIPLPETKCSEEK